MAKTEQLAASIPCANDRQILFIVFPFVLVRWRAYSKETASEFQIILFALGIPKGYVFAMRKTNVRQIEAFNAFMTSGSVTKAAEALHVSQPAVSKLLKLFEDSDLELFCMHR